MTPFVCVKFSEMKGVGRRALGVRHWALSVGRWALVSVWIATSVAAQSSGGTVLQQQIRKIAADAKGRVNVACALAGTPLKCDLNADAKAPMQSVFKLPVAVAVFGRIDAGRLSLDQLIRFEPDDRILPKTFSPLQDKYPDANVDVSLRELLRLAVSESDNVAADILLRVVGGPKVVSDDITSLGVSGFHLEDGEHGLHRDVMAQYRNWFTPTGAVTFLRGVGDGVFLSKAGTALVTSWMEHSAKSGRLKGDIPPGTAVAHKSGSSGVDDGLAHATNDIGWITLPDGRRLVIAVFVTDSRADEPTREKVIARIAKAAYDVALASR